jgi:hypothetical protein
MLVHELRQFKRFHMQVPSTGVDVKQQPSTARSIPEVGLSMLADDTAAG